jgi:hypothetical protein
MVVHSTLSFYKLHKRPSATICLGVLDRTLALRGYWDYDPLIDARLWPLHDREPHLFLFFGKGKSTTHGQIIFRLYTTLINLSPMAYRERTK